VLSSRIGHSYEVDLWSLGVITYTMLFGRPPFETRDVKLTYRKIKNNNYSFPSHVIVSDESKDFIKSLLKSDPKSRLCLDEIMNHSFLTNYPSLLPPSSLSCPPSSSYIAKFVNASDTAPKPGVSP
jgi:polo-like kinase 1